MVDLTGKVYESLSSFDENRSFTQYGWQKTVGLKLRSFQRIPIRPVRSFRMIWECLGMNAAEIAKATPIADSRISFRTALHGYMRRPVQG